MVGTRRCVALGFGLWTALAGAEMTTAATPRPSVLVHVDNRAGVPAQDLGRAQSELEFVFRAAGIDIEWSNAGLIGAMRESNATTGRRRVVVMLVNAGADEPRRTSGCPLGFAIPPGAMAYVFYNRLITLSRSQPVDLNVVLGRVIAHEVGHLLLPPGGHPNFGIMRATLDVAVKNPNRFTEDEAQKMRDGLARSREP